jgi:hypothetical protein
VTDDVGSQGDAIFEGRGQVLCRACVYDAPHRQQGRCTHPDARRLEPTFEGRRVVAVEPEERHTHTDCEGFLAQTARDMLVQVVSFLALGTLAWWCLCHVLPLLRGP